MRCSVVSSQVQRKAKVVVGAFWDIIQTELDRERFDVSDRKLALRLGVSPSTIANWRNGFTDLPDIKNLRAVAEFAGRSYEEVLLAALSDTGHADGTRLASGLVIGGAAKKVDSPRRPSRHP